MKRIYDESQFQIDGADKPGWFDQPKWDELVHLDGNEVKWITTTDKDTSHDM